MTYVTIWIQGDQAEVCFDYNPVAVRCMRDTPKAVWRPNLKAWTIPASSVRHLTAKFRHQGFTVETFAATSDWAESLMLRVGCDDKLFKRLAKALHPDAGGDNRLMQELNDSYKRCCGRGK